MARSGYPDQSELPEYHPVFDTVEERIKYCVKLKREREWTRGKTPRSLAKAWDVTVDAVKHYSKEANFRLSEELGRPLTVADRVEYIAGLMERMEWRTGKTAGELGALWHLDENTVEGYAAEASRRVTAQPEAIHRDITVGGLQLLRDAVERNDPRAFKQVGELLANISGISTKHLRHSHNHSYAVMVGTTEPGQTGLSIKALVEQTFGQFDKATKALPDPATEITVEAEPAGSPDLAGADPVPAAAGEGTHDPLSVDR